MQLIARAGQVSQIIFRTQVGADLINLISPPK